MQNTEIEIPANYLSFSENGWSLISRGMPVCKTGTKENCLAVADRMKIKLPSVFWNGISGEFQTA
jgi:hypothetical protein